MENCDFESNVGHNCKAEVALVESVDTTVVRQCNFTRGPETTHTTVAIHLHGTEAVSIEHNDFHGYHTVLMNTGEVKGAQVELRQAPSPRAVPATML